MESKLIPYLLGTKESQNVNFYDDRGSYNFFELIEMIDEIQSWLTSFHFEKKSNLLVRLGNQVEAIASIIAIIRCGLVAVPVSVSIPDPLFEEYANHVDGVAYISSDENRKTVINILNSKYTNYNNPNTCLILFTSGTTGNIKAVELSETALISTVSAVIEYMQCDSNDCFFVIKDYVHCACLISEIFVALVTGAKVCLYNPRLPFTILRKKIKNHNATIMGVNPWIVDMICRQQDYIHYYKSLRVLVSSGSVLTKELKKKAMDILPFAQIINVYGLTEACSRVCAQNPRSETDYTSVGKAIRGVELALTPCWDDINEIIIKSSGNMLGYYNNEQATKEKIQNGWIYSGDIGFFDADNNLIVSGRKDDLIISASNKVDPNRVDSILRQFSGVIDSYTIGVPDYFFGEKVVSIIEYEHTWNRSVYMEIIRFCKAYLFSYECPSHILPVDKIPRTASGKVLKADVLTMITNN